LIKDFKYMLIEIQCEECGKYFTTHKVVKSCGLRKTRKYYSLKCSKKALSKKRKNKEYYVNF